MVRSDHLVAIRDIGPGTEEQGAVGVHVLQEPVVAIGHDLDMLGGDVVGEHLLIAVTDNHFPVIPPGNTGRFSRRKDRQQSLDLVHRVARQRFGIRDQDGL